MLPEGFTTWDDSEVEEEIFAAELTAALTQIWRAMKPLRKNGNAIPNQAKQIVEKATKAFNERMAEELGVLGDDEDAEEDDDGLSDGAEINIYFTDPILFDMDGDGLNDGDELNSPNPTDPNNSDSDGDGVDDGDEVNTYGSDPNNSDSDGDECTDGVEIETHNTDPNVADTDEDGVDDCAEINQDNPTDPLDSDSDNDGLHDGAEQDASTDPNNPDTDGDTLFDGQEVLQGTDPLNTDTDGDGFSDDVESDANSSSLDPEDYPKGSVVGSGCSSVGANPTGIFAWLSALLGFVFISRRRK